MDWPKLDESFAKTNKDINDSNDDEPKYEHFLTNCSNANFADNSNDKSEDSMVVVLMPGDVALKHEKTLQEEELPQHVEVEVETLPHSNERKLAKLEFTELKKYILLSTLVT